MGRQFFLNLQGVEQWSPVTSLGKRWPILSFNSFHSRSIRLCLVAYYYVVGVDSIQRVFNNEINYFKMIIRKIKIRVYNLNLRQWSLVAWKMMYFEIMVI